MYQPKQIELQQEAGLLLELGNRLVRLYCRDCVPDITCLTKWTFRDSLIRSIAYKWNIPYDQLPGEQTLYRAFRENKYSSATREKLALFYYAITDPMVGMYVSHEYAPLAGIQRTQNFPYWNRFVKEIQEGGEQASANQDRERLKQLVVVLDEKQKAMLLEILQAEQNKTININRNIEAFEEGKAVA